MLVLVLVLDQLGAGVVAANFLTSFSGFDRVAYDADPARYRQYRSTCVRVGGRSFFVPPDGRGEKGPGLLRPRRLARTFDPELAVGWLATCAAFHGRPCRRAARGRGVPARLIDCGARRVVAGRAGDRYVALSYVWGLKGQTAEQMTSAFFAPPSGGGCPDKAKLPDRLPATVEDAMTVTRLLGYRYVWVDMFCIDQSDAEDKHRQIAHMDVVYAGADLTLIVAAGDSCHHGIPGVGARARQEQRQVDVDVEGGGGGGLTLCQSFGEEVGREIRESRWWTRAWTFQEALLSPRRLIFTPSQAFFECGTSSSVESIGGLELVHTQRELRLYQDIFRCRVFQGLFDGDGGTFNGFFDGGGDYRLSSRALLDLNTDPAVNRFQTLVRMYTEKTLSFESDALNAFNAIGMVFSREGEEEEEEEEEEGQRGCPGAAPHPPTESREAQNQRRVFNLSGIPFSSSPDRGARELSLTNGLLWWHGDGPSTQQRRWDFPSWTWAGFSGVVDWKCPVQELAWRIDGVETEGGGRVLDVTELELFRLSRRRRGSSADTTLVARAIRLVAPIVLPQMWEVLDFARGEWAGPPGSPWGTIHASPRCSGFAHASRELIPNLRSGRWSALYCGSSGAVGTTIVLFLVEMQPGGAATRIGLAKMYISLTLSPHMYSGHEEEHMYSGHEEEFLLGELEVFLQKGTTVTMSSGDQKKQTNGDKKKDSGKTDTIVQCGECHSWLPASNTSHTCHKEDKHNYPKLD
ncbi:HET-domain-containing protein [Xylariaceae sp. FL0804]|nr:HET-domain-containing protein [Xylariaceae sp. FL0804]